MNHNMHIVIELLFFHSFTMCVTVPQKLDTLNNGTSTHSSSESVLQHFNIDAPFNESCVT